MPKILEVEEPRCTRVREEQEEDSWTVDLSDTDDDDDEDVSSRNGDLGDRQDGDEELFGLCFV